MLGSRTGHGQYCSRRKGHLRRTVNINGEIDRVISDHVNCALDDPFHADDVDLMRLNAMESDHLLIDLVVLGTKQLGAQATMHTGPFVDTSFPRGMPEEGSVGDSRLLRRNAGVSLIRIPCIEMRVKVNNRDGAVHRLQRPQDRQDDRVISTQTDDAGMLPSLGNIGLMVQHLSISLFHLLEGMRRVEWGDGNITAVDDAQLFLEGIHAPDSVVAASLLLAGGSSANASRSEASAGTVRGAGIVGEAQDGNIEGLLISDGLGWAISDRRAILYCVRRLDSVAIPGGQM